MTDLLYTHRAAWERAIEECDERLKKRPNDPMIVAERRFCAHLAARFHARIEKHEQAQIENL